MSNSFYATEFLGQFTRGAASGINSNAPRIIELDGYGESFPDANPDGRVDFTDLLLLSQHYGAAGQTERDGDFNGDGLVGFTDLLILAQHYGRSTAPATLEAVPEPTLLAALCVVSLLPIRHRRFA